MNNLNVALSLLIILLVLQGFWLSFFNLVYRWLIDGDFLIQTFAVGLGVFGGMWANKKLQEWETIKTTLGALEIVDAELQSNIKTIDILKSTIEQRPSLLIRNNLTSDKILELTSDEEAWIGGFSSQLADNWFLNVLPTLSRIDNRKLFERLVNTYRDLVNMRLVINNKILIYETDSFTESQKNEFIRMGDQHFSLLTTNMGIFMEKLKNADDDIVVEERKLLSKIKNRIV